MGTQHRNDLFRSLQRLVQTRDGDELTDGQLLASFLENGSEEAIAAIVKRHGAMVWGVCRRLLDRIHDAEDAFQATFLVFVRRAHCIVPREKVGNWLYGVANQTAIKARAMNAKRMAKEKQVANMPEPQASENNAWSEVHPVLDQELSRLPDKYRTAIVLCDLEGKTRKLAARQLGIPDGTLAARLQRARILLAKRMKKHGLAISGGSIGVLLSRHASVVAAPPEVFHGTVKAASVLAAGKATAGVVSANAYALMQAVLHSMLLTKLKPILLLFLLLLTPIGAAMLIADSPAPPPEMVIAQHSNPTNDISEENGFSALAKTKGQWLLITTFRSKEHAQINAIRPDGFNREHTPVTDPDGHNAYPACSRDGKRMAYCAYCDGHYQVFTMSSDGGNPTRLTQGKEHCTSPAWSPDGKKIAYTRFAHDGAINVHVIDSDGRNDTNLTQGSGFDADPCWSPDGTKIAYASKLPGGWFQLMIMDSNGANRRVINRWGGAFVYPAWSPDGNKIVFGNLFGSRTALFVVDVDGSNRRLLTHYFDDSGDCRFPEWSPDGKQIAFVQVLPGGACICTIDSDGNNLRPLVSQVNYDGGEKLRLSWRK